MIYDRLINLRNSYQDGEDYGPKYVILFNLMEIAFRNNDALPSNLIVDFPYFDYPYSYSKISSMILEILKDLEMCYHYIDVKLGKERLLFTFVRD